MIFKKIKKNPFNHLTEPPDPWGNRIVISASGIIASGWTNSDKVFLLSPDGYSISNPLTGEEEIRNRDDNNVLNTKFSEDNLEYKIDEIDQNIKVFGIRGGNGNHLTTDNWNLDSFHLGLGQQIVGLRNLKDRNSEAEYWKSFTLIRLVRLENFSLTYGFSPNQKLFGIFGSGGAEIFSRK